MENYKKNPTLDAQALEYVVPRGKLGARWLLVWLLFMGFLFTISAYEDVEFYFVLTLLAIFSCVLLLTRLGNPINITLPIWVILGVFLIGYYFKFYWMTWVLQHDAAWPFDPLFLAPASSRSLMFEAYRVTALGFVTFCLTSWLFLGKRKGKVVVEDERSATDDQISRRRIARFSIVIIIGLTILMVITGYAQYLTGVGIMGRDNVVLPFRMAGLIVHSRNVLIPTLYLLIIWLTDKWKLQQIFCIAIGLLIVHGLSQMVLASSRGALVNYLVPVFFLWLLTRRFTTRRLIIMLMILFLIFMLHPIISAYRVQRAVGEPSDIVGALTEALKASGNLVELLENGIVNIISRVIGVDGLLFAIAWGEGELSLENLRYYLFNPEGRSLARIYTQDVVGFGPSVTWHQNAPSLLGAFYLIGGNMGVVLGMSLWVIFWMLLWKGLKRQQWRILPVIQACCLGLLWYASMEGNIDFFFFFQWPMLGASLLLGEILIRTFVWRVSRQSRVIKI
jgi:hypothetical protein